MKINRALFEAQSLMKEPFLFWTSIYFTNSFRHHSFVTLPWSSDLSSHLRWFNKKPSTLETCLILCVKMILYKSGTGAILIFPWWNALFVFDAEDCSSASHGGLRDMTPPRFPHSGRMEQRWGDNHAFEWLWYVCLFSMHYIWKTRAREEKKSNGSRASRAEHREEERGTPAEETDTGKRVRERQGKGKDLLQ